MYGASTLTASTDVPGYDKVAVKFRFQNETLTQTYK